MFSQLPQRMEWMEGLLAIIVYYAFCITTVCTSVYTSRRGIITKGTTDSSTLHVSHNIIT